MNKAKGLTLLGLMQSPDESLRPTRRWRDFKPRLYMFVGLALLLSSVFASARIGTRFSRSDRR